MTDNHHELITHRYARHRIYLANCLAAERTDEWEYMIPSVGLLYRRQSDHYLVTRAENWFRSCRIDVRSCIYSWDIGDVIAEVQGGSLPAILRFDSLSAGLHWLGHGSILVETADLFAAFIDGVPGIWSIHSPLAKAILSEFTPLPEDPMIGVWMAISRSQQLPQES